MADPAIAAAHEQHAYLGDLCHHHRVVAGAARQARRLDGTGDTADALGPALLHAGRTPYARDIQDLAPLDRDPPARGNAFRRAEHARVRRVAQLIADGADVHTQLATAGDHVRRTPRDLQLSDRAHQSRRTAAALLDGQDDFGGGRSSVAAQGHRHGARVARQAGNGDQAAYAAGDRRHHAKWRRRVEQHRTLLDVYLHETEKLAWVEGRRRNFRRIEPRRHHGLAHGNSVGIARVEYCRIEPARERAAAEECRPEAHAFFLGKSNDGQRVRQPHSRTAQLGNHRYGQQYPQPSIEPSGVDDRVVVRARHQGALARGGVTPAPDDVTDIIDFYLEPRRQ